MGLKCFVCGKENLLPKQNSGTGEFWAACDSCGQVFPPGKCPNEAVQHTLWLQSEAWDGFEARLGEVKGLLGEATDRKAVKSLAQTFDLINQVLAYGPAQAPEAWVQLCQSYPNLAKPL